MMRSGSVDLLLPSDMMPSEEFGRSRYWMRALWRGASTDEVMNLRRLLFNTVMATNKVSIRNELLGSGNGLPHQVVRAAHAGILAHSVLEVREADWLAWDEVAHFADSDPEHRHYILDHATGEIRFGDGIHGKVPPAGRGNIRFSLYATGGGRVGNVPAGSITQMRSAIPYVEQVTNPTAAHGGADTETSEQFAARAPAVLRHHHRAVTAQDFEDLAELASPAVARARCLPCVDLSLDPDALQVHPGTTTVIVVPRSESKQPLPSLELLNQVKTFLDERCSPGIAVIAHGPEYLTVDIDAEIVIDSLDHVSETEAAMRRAIDAFLHPLSGAHDGSGWAFGRRPHRSDVYGVLSRIECVNHIRSVSMRYRGRSGLDATRHFLVSAGDFRSRFFLS
jgi:predicted phage baseplate assembly protein